MIKKPLTIIFMIFLVLISVSQSLYSTNNENNKQNPDLLARKPITPQPQLPFRQLSKPAPGKFLIAGRQMRDTRFAETVILLIRYDWEGAMGVIINMPTELKISQAFPDLKGFSKKADLIFWGGPVEMHKAFMLIRSKNTPDDTIHILDDIYFGTSQALLESISNSNDNSERSRVYLGYAGWARGQLDREILRGGWRVMSGDAETVFSKKPEDVWNKFILLDPTQQVMAR